LNHFPITLTHRFIDLGQNWLGQPFGHTMSCFSSGHNFLQCRSHPFFIPNLGKSHIAIMWPTCFVRISHIQPTILSLFFYQGVDFASHSMNKPTFYHYTLCPWYFSCPFCQKLSTAIIWFFLFLSNPIHIWFLFF
jgi:hypothetical protein